MSRSKRVSGHWARPRLSPAGSFGAGGSMSSPTAKAARFTRTRRAKSWSRLMTWSCSARRYGPSASDSASLASAILRSSVGQIMTTALKPSDAKFSAAIALRRWRKLRSETWTRFASLSSRLASQAAALMSTAAVRKAMSSAMDGSLPIRAVTAAIGSSAWSRLGAGDMSCHVAGRSVFLVINSSFLGGYSPVGCSPPLSCWNRNRRPGEAPVRVLRNDDRTTFEDLAAVGSRLGKSCQKPVGRPWELRPVPEAVGAATERRGSRRPAVVMRG